MYKQELLKHYETAEDKLLIAKLLDKIKERDQKNRIVTTDFLNLHEEMICEELLKKQKTENYVFYGGYEEAERKILILYPDKLEEEYIKKHGESWLMLLRVALPKYQEAYSHREYLGGIMKLGLKREKIGDILVLEDGADIIVQKEIAIFLKQELEKLTRFHKANMEVKSICEVRNAISKTEEMLIIIPSYRIDAVLSEMLRISRSKSSDVIKDERVFLNGVLCQNGAKTIKVGDKITVRGKGRFEIIEELGNTKKENIRMKIIKNI